ncbi:MAG: hypothetical protein ACI9KE_001087 [Polyangiales bacterium]|jgi:hypothetical protein
MSKATLDVHTPRRRRRSPLMQAHPVPAAVARLEAIGVRAIVKRETFAVMELRGGTHIVVREPKESQELDQPSFDLMSDSSSNGLNPHIRWMQRKLLRPLRRRAFRSWGQPK